MARLDEVFGVSSKPVLSYVERHDVDTRFVEAISSDKEIIVYGSSKQGKTALVSKHLPYDQHFLVSLTPKASVLDIYQSILSKAGVRVTTSVTDRRSTESTISIGTKVKAILPLFGAGEASADGGLKAGSGAEMRSEEIPINLELPLHVADLLRRVRSTNGSFLRIFTTSMTRSKNNSRSTYGRFKNWVCGSSY
jgi:hypothetical protein